MVNDPIKRKKLYDYLSSEKMTDLDYETFSSEYATNPEKQEKLYAYLSQNKMTELDYKSFTSEYFGDVKKKDLPQQNTPLPSGGSKSDTSKQNQVGSLESSNNQKFENAPSPLSQEGVKPLIPNPNFQAHLPESPFNLKEIPNPEYNYVTPKDKKVVRNPEFDSKKGDNFSNPEFLVLPTTIATNDVGQRKSLFKIDSEELKKVKEEKEKIVRRYEVATKNSDNPQTALIQAIESDGTLQELNSKEERLSDSVAFYNKMFGEIAKDTNSKFSKNGNFLDNVASAFGISETPDEIVELNDGVKEQLLLNISDKPILQQKLARGTASLEEKEALIKEAKANYYKNQVQNIQQATEIIKNSNASVEEKNKRLSILEEKFNTVLGNVGFDDAGNIADTFTKTTEAKNYQEALSGDSFINETGDAFSTILGGLINTSLKGGIGFIGDSMAWTGDLFTDQKEYSVFDAFGDTLENVTGYQFTPDSKDQSKSIIDEEGNLNFNYGTVTKSLGNTLPFTLYLINEAKKGNVSNLEKTFGQFLNPKNSAEASSKIKLVDSAFRATFSDNMDEAEELGLTGFKKGVFSTAKSLAEGTAELILPDTKFLNFSQTSKNVIGAFAGDLNKAVGKKAVRDVTVGFFKNVFGEIAEEEVNLASGDLIKASLVSGNQNSDFWNLKNQKDLLANTAIMSTVMSTVGLRNSYLSQKTEIYKGIADNVETIKEGFLQSISDPNLSEEQKNNIQGLIDFADNVSTAVKTSPKNVTSEQIEFLVEKQQLIKERSSLDPAFHESINEQIKTLDDKIKGASKIDSKENISPEDTKFDPLESEGEAIDRLSKPLNNLAESEKEAMATTIAKEHAKDYFDYVSKQENSEEILNSPFAKNFEENTKKALLNGGLSDSSQERSAENGSRIDENGNTISEIDFLKSQNKINTEADNTNTEASNAKTDAFSAIDNVLENPIAEKTIETNINTYNVSLSDGELQITPTLGKAKPSASERKKVIEKYIESTDFNTGKKAITNDKGTLSPDQVNQIVAEESENPQEIAQAILIEQQNPTRQEQSQITIEDAISEAFLSYKISREDAGVSDVPFPFTTGRSKQKVNSLDAIVEKAQSIYNASNNIDIDAIDASNAGYDSQNVVSRGAVESFLSTYKSASDYSSQNPIGTNLETELSEKLQKLTGLKPTKETIEKIAGQSQETQQEQETDQDSEVDDEVPFQTESNQTRISGEELTNLVDRLKKTGLAKAVKVLSDNQVIDFLKNLGINEKILRQSNFNFSQISKEVLPIDTINSVRASLRRSFPDSFSLELLDAVQKNEIDNLEFEAQQLAEQIQEEGLTYGQLSNLLIYDEIVNSKKEGISKVLNIGEKGRNISNYIRLQKEFSEKGVAVTPNGFVHNGIVYLNKDKVKADTPIHEFGHLWNSYAKKNLKEQYARGLELIKGSEYHEAVKNNPAYDNLSEEGKLEEALAQAIGEKGVKILNEAKKKTFGQWFTNLFSRIAKGLGISSITGDKLADLTLDKYTDLVSAELLSGKPIVKNSAPASEKNRTGEADITNIEVIMAEAEATKKTRDSINQKMRDKNSLIKDVKNELVKFINKSIDSKRLSEIQKRELSKLLTLVKNAKTKNQLTKAFGEVNEIVLGLDNKIILGKIDKILGSKLSKKESGRRKANITDEQAEIMLKEIKDNISTPKGKNDDRTVPERRSDRYAELYVERQELIAKDDLTEAEVNKLEAINISLDILYAITTKDVASANAYLIESFGKIDSIYTDGRNRLKELREKRAEEDAKLISDINEDINPDGKTTLKTTKELQSENRSLLNSFKRALFTINHGSLIGSLDSLSTLISRKGGDNRDSSPLVQFVNKLKKRETLKKSRVGYFSKKVTDSQKAIFGSVSKSDNALNRKVSMTLERYPNNDKSEERQPVTIELTNSQLLNTWMNYQNPSLRAGLDANGFTDEVMANIDQSLSQEMKDYAQELFNIYNEMYEDSNEVYTAMNFHSLGKEENYAGKVYRSNTSLKENTDALLGGVTSINTTGYGSQKERVINDKPIEAVDVNFLVRKAIQESSHYVAYAEIHREYNKILSNQDIQKSIQLTNKGTGDLILDTLNYYKVRDLEQGGDRGIPIIDFFGRNIAQATLALKAKIGITQMISIVNGSFDMPTGLSPLKFISYYNPVDTISTMRFLLKNSEYLKSRYDVGGIDQAMLGLADLASQSETSFKNSSIESKRKAVARYYRKMMDYAMLNVKLGDAVGVMGSIPAYNAWLDKYKAQGMSDAMAQEKAIEKFEASVDRSQQTTSTFGKSKFQKHPVARYFTMFATAPIQNQQNAFYHFRELKRGLLKGTDSAKGSNVRNALAFLNYQFAQPMLYTYIAGVMSGSLLKALGFGYEEPDDADKDLLRTAIMGNYNSVPVIGGISQLLIETALGKEQSFGSLVSSALLDNTTKLQEAWMKAYTAPSESVRQKNTEKALKLTSGLLSGLPNFIFDNYDAIDEIYWNDEIDTEVKFLKGLGYNDYVILQSRTQRISRAKSDKEKEKIKKKYERSIRKYEKSNKKTNPIFKPLDEKKKR